MDNRENHIQKYWQQRLEKCRKALEENNFAAYVADDPMDAKSIVVEKILPEIKPKTVSWGDSMTLYATGILDEIRQNPESSVLETVGKNATREQVMERGRKALQSDLFLTGSNAVTETGKLVNLDMIGNRTSAITFGPLNVIIVAGRNKIVPDIEAAMLRIKSYAAPVNAIRHSDINTPCKKTSSCTDCSSPERICNTWTITEKSYPKRRIRVVLINKDLGL